MITNCKACLKDDFDNCTNDGTCPNFPSKPISNLQQNIKDVKNQVNDFINDWNEQAANIESAPQEIIIKVKHSDSERIDLVATRLINKYKFVTAEQSNTIYMFTGKIYENKKAETTIKKETEIQIENCKESDSLEVIAKIKRKTFEDLKDFDKDSNFVNLENGILNLETMELKPHTPTYLSKVLIPCNYIEPFSYNVEENLKHTLFWKFLKSSFTIKGKTNQEDMKTVLEIMASVFLKRNVDERSVMFLGGGENGKSVCLDYIKFLLGKDNFSSIPLQVLANDTFSVANLDGKLANIFPDLEKDELKHTGTFKDLSSNESIYAQKKYGQPFDLVPMTTQIFSTNRFPKTSDQGQGFFRRWIIVKWSRNFEKDPDRDNHLKQKLLENLPERDIVFSTLVHISRELLKNNEFTYSKDWKVIQKEWNENADPLDDFIENYIVESERSRTKIETYQFYKRTMFSKSETPLGIGKFGKAFSEYFEDSKSGNNRVWLNIDFTEPKQELLEEYDNNE